MWHAGCFPVTVHSELGAPEGGAGWSDLAWALLPGGLFRREEVPLCECQIDCRAMPPYSVFRMGMKGRSWAWWYPPSAGTCCLCRHPGWGGSGEPGELAEAEKPCERGREISGTQSCFVPAPSLLTRVSGEEGWVEAPGRVCAPLLLLAPQAASPTPWNWPSALQGAGGAVPIGGWGPV